MKELKIKNEEVRKIANKLKEDIKNQTGSEDVKLVGWGFMFLVNNELLVNQFMYAKGFDPDDFY